MNSTNHLIGSLLAVLFVCLVVSVLVAIYEQREQAEMQIIYTAEPIVMRQFQKRCLRKQDASLTLRKHAIEKVYRLECKWKESQGND